MAKIYSQFDKCGGKGGKEVGINKNAGEKTSMSEQQDSITEEQERKLIRKLGQITVNGLIIDEKKQYIRAIENDDMDIIIRQRDINQPKIFLKGTKQFFRKPLTAITAFPFYESATGIGGRDWRSRASCFKNEAEFFFASGTSNNHSETDLASAFAICSGCLVRADCLEFALAQNSVPFGIWAGLGHGELKRIKKQRRQFAAESTPPA